MILACALIFGIGYLIQTAFAPSNPEPTPTEILETSVPTEPAEPEPKPTDFPEELGIGSTMVSEVDGMTMVYVPAGEFQTGSENGDSDEKPIHTVSLDTYWIDQTEVTNAMYARCVNAGECDPPTSAKSSTRENYYGNSEYDDYPVINVSWDDAKAYCEWAGRRLPSEAEWEKAAGWDDENQNKFVYPWGDSIDCSQANYWDKDGGCVGDTTAVGSYESGQSPYGAYDMAGNVWEWVADWYDVYPGGDESTSEYFGQMYRVLLRGGAWNVNADSVRSADRNWLNPTAASNSIGFRCSRSQ